MNKVYLLLGSNLGDRALHLYEAIRQLNKHVGSVQKASSIYESQAWGTDIPLPYLNIVAFMLTEKEPDELLKHILEIEKAMGRLRSEEKNMPRTVDIDILFYNDEVINRTNLVVPHERLHLRKFALIPLVELAPNLVHPLFNRSIEDILNTCPDNLWVKKYNPDNTHV